MATLVEYLCNIFEPCLSIVLASTAKVKIKQENSVLITRSDIVVLRENKENGRDGPRGLPAPKRVEGVSKPKQEYARSLTKHTKAAKERMIQTILKWSKSVTYKIVLVLEA